MGKKVFKDLKTTKIYISFFIQSNMFFNDFYPTSELDTRLHRNTNKDIVCEYIWIGGHGEIRSKTKVLYCVSMDILTMAPEWNFDGSSTDQAPSNGNTEVTIKPVALFKNPLHPSSNNCLFMIVLCDTYDHEGNPLPTNHRVDAKKVFMTLQKESCWFGLEQEYFIDFHDEISLPKNNGSHYCGKSNNNKERKLVEEHLKCCMDAEINISGINAEVATNQWEFQIGPSVGIEAADELIVARFLLERIAEKYNASIDYSPKIVDTANGSGCHINFSTAKMRNKNGIDEILICMDKLKETHAEHITCYGENNEKRLTGLHETSSYNEFTWGIGTRNTSVRIPTLTHQNGCGYFEDRRPAANIDPYLATSVLAKTCCL